MDAVTVHAGGAKNATASEELAAAAEAGGQGVHAAMPGAVLRYLQMLDEKIERLKELNVFESSPLQAGSLSPASPKAIRDPAASTLALAPASLPASTQEQLAEMRSSMEAMMKRIKQQDEEIERLRRTRQQRQES